MGYAKVPTGLYWVLPSFSQFHLSLDGALQSTREIHRD